MPNISAALVAQLTPEAFAHFVAIVLSDDVATLDKIVDALRETAADMDNAAMGHAAELLRAEAEEIGDEMD